MDRPEGERCENYDTDNILWDLVKIEKQFVDSELDPWKHFESNEMALILRS